MIEDIDLAKAMDLSVQQHLEIRKFGEVVRKHIYGIKAGDVNYSIEDLVELCQQMKKREFIFRNAIERPQPTPHPLVG